MLAKMGYAFDIDDLDPWQIEAYRIIENTIGKEREREMKKRK